MDWYKLGIEQTIGKLGVSPATGLAPDEAERRLAEYGPNELVERGAKPAWKILLDQFTEVMVIVLIVAAIVSGEAEQESQPTRPGCGPRHAGFPDQCVAREAPHEPRHGNGATCE